MTDHFLRLLSLHVLRRIAEGTIRAVPRPNSNRLTYTILTDVRSFVNFSLCYTLYAIHIHTLPVETISEHPSPVFRRQHVRGPNLSKFPWGGYRMNAWSWVR